METVPILYNFCGTCSSYVIFFFPEKGKGERKKREGGKKKDMGEKGVFPISFEEIFFPPSLFGKEKYDVTGVVFLKINTNSGQFLLCHLFAVNYPLTQFFLEKEPQFFAAGEWGCFCILILCY